MTTSTQLENIGARARAAVCRCAQTCWQLAEPYVKRTNVGGTALTALPLTRDDSLYAMFQSLASTKHLDHAVHNWHDIDAAGWKMLSTVAGNHGFFVSPSGTNAV